MLRRVTLVGVCLTLSACSSEGGAPGDRSVVIVSDSLGNLPASAVPSPDGSRIVFPRTVAGKSSVFIAAADGSNPVQLSHGVWDVNPVWSPDGRWIAYHGEAPDFDVFLISVDGGEPRQLTSGPALDIPVGWLKDGSAVVVSRQRDGDDYSLLVPVDGSPTRRLGAVMKGNQHGFLSPDESKFAFDLHQGAGAATIWVQDLAGGGAPRQLTTENLENVAPIFMWSPDGRSLAYTSRRTGTWDIWIVDVASGETRQLTNDIRDDTAPRWSPDGRWIAFLSERGGQTDLWVVPSAGGNAVRVTNDRAEEAQPRWTPDGHALIYGSTDSQAELQLLPTDSGPPRTLLSWPGYSIDAAVLSPDDKTVLFVSDRSGNPDVWSLSVSGGEPVPFAASPLPDYAPRYSRDGSQVIFLSNRGGSPDLWIVPATGGEPRRLTSDPSSESVPAWSPDGKTIVYASDRDAAGGDLWTIPAAGGEPARLTRDDLRPNSADWSPDGRWIYFVGVRPAGGRDVYRIAATGGRPQPLGANSNVGNSALSPDGSQLAYTSFEGGWAFQDLMPAAGGPSRRLTQQTERVYQPGARWSPDGSVLAVADLDFDANRDSFDAVIVRPADGSSRRLTHTPRESEFFVSFTRDGRQLLVVYGSESSTVRSIAVEQLLAGSSAK